MSSRAAILRDVSLSKEQAELVRHFEADFNLVENYLHSALGLDKHLRFTDLIKEYAKTQTGWTDLDFLRRVAKIRNLMVHEKREPHGVPVVPTPAIAEELKNCAERLLNPARAIPTFKRAVKSIYINDSLTGVLRLVHQRDYSQFPVYEGTTFRGLLTENGVTRWLARYAANSLSAVKLDEIQVLEILQAEEQRKRKWRALEAITADQPSSSFLCPVRINHDFSMDSDSFMLSAQSRSFCSICSMASGVLEP